jgi:hypothetical protein
LTHIDAVPEHLIPEAVNAVAADFEIDPGQIVPICGQWGRPSNREGVAEALESVLPEAEKLKVARCIRQIRREQDEDKLIHQVINGLRLAGGWIAKK